MPSTSASFSRDANRVPITRYGITTIKDHTLIGNNATVTAPIFSFTGTVELIAIYGVVTTVLGSNVTAAAWRINDTGAQVDLTAVAGTTISAAPVGSSLRKSATNGTALTYKSSASANLTDASVANFAPTILIQKTGGVASNIEFVYTTTNTPTSGVIRFYAGWLPISDDGNLVAL